MALAWKAGWVNSPQGFESPILHHPKQGLTCENADHGPKRTGSAFMVSGLVVSVLVSVASRKAPAQHGAISRLTIGETARRAGRGSASGDGSARRVAGRSRRTQFGVRDGNGHEHRTRGGPALDSHTRRN